MKDRRVDGVRDDCRLAELETELAVLLEAVPRLEDRRLGELGVHRSDRRSVPSSKPRYTPIGPSTRCTMRQSERAKRRSRCGVEVERVEETGRRLGGDPVQLDLEPRCSSSATKRTQELMTAAGRRRRELVEEREVGSSATRAEPVELNPPTSHDVARNPSDRTRSRTSTLATQPRGGSAIHDQVRLHT